MGYVKTTAGVCGLPVRHVAHPCGYILWSVSVMIEQSPGGRRLRVAMPVNHSARRDAEYVKSFAGTAGHKSRCPVVGEKSRPTTFGPYDA